MSSLVFRKICSLGHWNGSFRCIAANRAMKFLWNSYEIERTRLLCRTIHLIMLLLVRKHYVIILWIYVTCSFCAAFGDLHINIKTHVRLSCSKFICTLRIFGAQKCWIFTLFEFVSAVSFIGYCFQLTKYNCIVVQYFGSSLSVLVFRFRKSQFTFCS